MKNWLILFLLILLLGSVGATISNIHISPEYPNLDASLIKVYADVSDVSQATLYYRINDITYSNYFSISKGVSSFIYEDIVDNLKVFYWIETTNSSGEKETTEESSFTYDGSAPVISINGDNPLTIQINSTYEELGTTALDNVYGDLTSSIIISGSVDTTTLGEYIITYNVSDSAGNIATATRTIRVVEQPSPVSSSSGGGSNSDSSSSSSSSESEIIQIITNSTETNVPESSNNPPVKETDTKAGITGKSIVELIGENKGTSIVVGVLTIGAIVGWFFLKREVKRKLWGK
jgi:hypothetical protein